MAGHLVVRMVSRRDLLKAITVGFCQYKWISINYTSSTRKTKQRSPATKVVPMVAKMALSKDYPSVAYWDFQMADKLESKLVVLKAQLKDTVMVYCSVFDLEQQMAVNLAEKKALEKDE